ncbi:uncharacterized protein LOC127530799 [Acanthochromis polyacanthus]|uniref:uncharacterized protein LOC127530799 n=1 Tax=Acanthochromis polyacanthus TaxID=80966 RepID=UPI002233F324|nr:uncharacterized protein LOC127530799 [Acanthochromis polyacanthus]
MDGLKPPQQWCMDSANLAKSWKSWKEEFMLYIELAMPDAEEKARVKLFYYLIGERGRELCGTLIGSDARVTVSSLMAKLNEHCNPKVNETVERYRFFAHNQAPGEAIDKYVMDLRTLASSCNFGDLKESLIRDRIVCGTYSSSWRERLLREDNLDLDKCLKICRSMEISREYSRTIEGHGAEDIHAFKHSTRKAEIIGVSCRYCGKTHERLKQKCPAFGKKCRKCGKDNHFAVTCRSKAGGKEHKKTVHTVAETDSESCEDIMTVTAVTSTAAEVNQIKEKQNSNTEQLFAGMMINRNLVSFQIDCGATCNVIPINLLNPDVKLEHTDKDELSTQNGLVFRGERVVIPDSLQKDITQRIHSSHLGTEGCLRRARDCVYWHGMNDHIKKHVAKCDTCRSVDIKQQKETLQPHEIITRPWAKVGTDLFTFDNKDYLLTVDYYSNFWEVDYLPDTKSITVIRKLKAHFARQGIPDVVFSDNGPQYSSAEFSNFSHRWEFKHKTSSPGYPQSNGKAESAVKTAKRLMRKAKMAGQDPYLAILDHRNTPTQGLDTSPAQRLLSRRTRTLLPIRESLLEPKVINNSSALRRNQQRQSKYYNQTAKDMDSLKPGDVVRVQPFEPNTLWRKATVNTSLGNRSYAVELDTGSVLRRNRRHLRKAVAVQSEMSEQPQTKTRLDPVSQNTANPQTTTRSGRVIQRPRHLNDYVCTSLQ